MQRRQFLQTTLAGATALALPQLAARAADSAADPYLGLKVGVASYSLRKFTLDQAIAMTKELGLRYICLKDMHLPMKSTAAERREAYDKVAAAGLVMMGCGVVNMKKEDEEIRSVFEYAKEAGMPTIVCSPDPEGMNTIEKLAKEYDIRIAIHNHGPGDKRWPSPLDALRAVEDRDERLGICIDVGHTVRINEDPVAAIQRCAKRLYDFHLKDVTAAAAEGKPVVIGTGVINIPAVLKALLDAKFAGHLGLEYEIDADSPLPGMKQSLQYVRTSLAKLA
ncbi:MAG: sugar phosphate isomerase/epimerase [Planctomycetes bacterium]|nr:sugar phosphate isomerase/epimerase [Planctomycetota bacterium]